MGAAIYRRNYIFQGRVQGVGFRYHARSAAEYFGVTGWVRNCYDGTVEMELQGTLEQMKQVLKVLQNATFVHIEGMETKEIPLEEERGFRVR